MRVLDLFSGIGGFSLGLERAGMETVAFCEYDKKAQLVLKKHWPDVPIFEDVRKLNGKQFEGQTIDLICGGFPCQPFSVAGKRRGKEDDRHLWPEYFRLIQEIRPRWVIGENVAGLINMGLDQVLSDLESADYSCQTLIIPACAVNAPHRRDRVWILAYSINSPNRTWSGKTGKEDDLSGEHREEGCSGLPFGTSSNPENVADTNAGFELRQEGKIQARRNPSNDGSEDVPDTDPKGLQKRERQDPGRAGTDGRAQSERDKWWAVEPDVGRVVDGLSLELDFSRQIKDWCNEKSNPQEKKPARNELVKRLLRTVWEQREIAEASPELYVNRLQDCVPEVPLRNTQSRWLLGSRIEKNQRLRDLWEAFYSEPLEKTQDLQFRLLEQAWSEKRKQTVGGRVGRLKQLGNAVVPQIVEIIGRAIMEVESALH